MTINLELLSQNLISYTQNNPSPLIGDKISIFEDTKGEFNINNIRFQKFHNNETPTINIGLSSSTYWIKFSAKNLSNERLHLVLDQPNLNLVQLYHLNSSGDYTLIEMGDHQNFSERKYKHPSYVFDLDLLPDSTKSYYIKIKSEEPISLPLFIFSTEDMTEFLLNKNAIMGFFFGIIFVMIFYNLFVLFAVRNNNYIIYITYLIFLLLGQSSIQGYSFQYLWPESEWLKRNSFFLFAPIVSILAIFFFLSFLNVKTYLPKSFLILKGCIFLFFLSLVLLLLGHHSLSFHLTNVLILSSAFIIFASLLTLYNKGYKLVRFFLIGWSFLILGACIYTLKLMGFLPHNDFTNYSTNIGSLIEVIFLSFALTDKINYYKEEHLKAIQEKEKLLIKQKELLKTEVNSKTLEIKEKLNLIEESNIEKDFLLKEIHDRVKNNLQVIISLLALQKMSIKNEDTYNVINNSQNRIQSMALVHELLYQTKTLSSIDYNTYITKLIDHLFLSYQKSIDDLEITIKTSSIFFTIDTAIILGLIVNEIITNSLKHAFPNSQKGSIEVALTNTSPNYYSLEISDNGIGYDDLLISHKKSLTLGLKLIHRLTRQINGKLEKVASWDGTKYTLNFQCSN